MKTILPTIVGGIFSLLLVEITQPIERLGFYGGLAASFFIGTVITYTAIEFARRLDK